MVKNPFKKKNFSLVLRKNEGQMGEVQQETKKRPGRIYKEEALPSDAYYEKLSVRTKIFRQIVTLLLVFFGIGMTFLFTGEITKDTFRLMFRNMSFSFPGEKTEFKTVRYDADVRMDFAPYKKAFAVSDTTGLCLYDHRGNIIFEQEYTMKNPTLSVGDTYVLVYDRDGKNYHICNSVSTLYSNEEEYTLYMADMSDCGMHLTLSSSPKYLSVIRVYNKTFQKMKELKIDRYPLSAELSEDGKRMLFLSYDINGKGLPEGHLTVYSLGEETKILGEYVYTDIPLGAKMLDDGKVAALFPSMLRIYSEDFQTEQNYSFTEQLPTEFYFGDTYLAMTFEKNEVLGRSEIVLLPYDEQEERITKEYQNRIDEITVLDNRFYFFSNGQIIEYHLKNDVFTVLSEECPKKLVSSKDGTLFACYGNKAENIGNTGKDMTDTETNRKKKGQ